VIAFRHGSVPELIEDGVTGFIVSTVEEAVQAVSQVPTVSRGCCRQVFEERFSVTRMVEDYLQIYHRLVEKRLSHVAA
jgi:glycosyltransferase involved in cell wall biosynthesis